MNLEKELPVWIHGKYRLNIYDVVPPNCSRTEK
jgi:hypothetical protein